MVKPGKILITGAAGFVGVALCRRLHDQGFALRVLLRRGGSLLPEDLAKVLDDVVMVDDLAGPLPWPALLDGVESIVHLAARAHGTARAGCSSDHYFDDNLDAAVALGRAAVKAKVSRFIFLSTIKVNGEGAWDADHPSYKASDKPRPQGSYAVSKWRAEQELQRLCELAEGPNLIIIRPPLVYGPGVKGNFAALLRWLNWGLPVPVARLANRRSLLYLDNLVSLIEYCLLRADVSGRVLLPADPDDWSLAGLVGFLAGGLGCRARILQVPDLWLRWGAKMFRREDYFIKIFGSLRVDSRALDELDWCPPVVKDDLLRDCTRWL
ncbi:MAG: NAD-dependent epimerase/dehydratase family protein [Pseudomonadota bacterium]|nr:NAD-dependent epimerase/dehydratase family protein [Pseudomonadota bacterium]